MMYVVRNNNSIVYRYNATTGVFVDQFITNPTGIAAGSLAFGSAEECYVVLATPTGVAGSRIVRYAPSSLAAFTMSLSAGQSATTSVGFSTANGTAVAGSDYADASGTVDFAPGETVRTILVATIDDTTYEGNETFTVNLSNPVGGSIADGQGVGTIVDNELPPTKFYVVDDGSANKTFEYGASGAVIENYAVNSGNSAPRGAASTAAGDKVWVVDSNRNVYVYNTSGGLLGSWAVGGFNNSAQLEGITVSGSDVWIVDAKSDKVYRYSGAATRLTGSQSAASSFSLNGSNTSPTDLVTDGASVWVLNDSSTDKVFKYTSAGSLLGSWTITGSGGSPTGITLDPSVASGALWIVDNATDRVYQFDNARSLTSGSLTATSSFALAAGNTNPQGIADPPSGSSAAAADTALLSYLGEEELQAAKRRR